MDQILAIYFLEKTTDSNVVYPSRYKGLAQTFFYDHNKPTSVMIFITAKKNNTLIFSNNNCTILRIITSVLKIDVLDYFPWRNSL